MDMGDTSLTRLIYADGRVEHYADSALALALWYGAARGVRVAFRSAGDCSPVYPWDCVDRG